MIVKECTPPEQEFESFIQTDKKRKFTYLENLSIESLGKRIVIPDGSLRCIKISKESDKSLGKHFFKCLQKVVMIIMFTEIQRKDMLKILDDNCMYVKRRVNGVKAFLSFCYLGER